MGRFAEVFGNRDYTENGAICFKSTGSTLLDLFANIGGMREENEARIITNWKKARCENEELSDNLVLYVRGIRNGGIGERRIGRLLLHELAVLNPLKVQRNFQKIVDNGRWDDLFALIDTPAEHKMWEFIGAQLRKDVETAKSSATKPISLLAKWCPSINTSSGETKELARKLCKNLGLTERTYRKTLSMLRKRIRVVESLMSAGDWNEINFEAVPSIAMSNYSECYDRRCGDRFREYLNALENGEAKVNAGALSPANIVKKFFSERKLSPIDVQQWKSLPNYVDGEFDVLVMADTSGSMYDPNCEPIAASIGLATYFAQRNKGAYHGKYMTFSSDPQLITLDDNDDIATTFDKINNGAWGMSTDLDKALEIVYNIALESRDVPKALIVISDGEFDSYNGKRGESIVAKWNRKLNQHGLPSTKVLSWNVASRHDHVVAPPSDNVAFVSGRSAGAFKNLMTYINKSAYEAMEDVLTQKQFQWE